MSLLITRFSIKSALYRLLEGCILLAFFLISWDLQLYWAWLPQSFYGVYAVALPVYGAMAVWVLLGAPGLLTVMDSRCRWWAVVLLVLAAWSRLSATWSLAPDRSGSAALALAVTITFSLVVLSAGPSARRITAALACGIIVQAVIGIAQSIVQRPLDLVGLGEYALKVENLGLSVVVSGADRIMRAYGLSQHPNIYGGFLAVATLALAGWIAQAATGRQRAIWGGVLALGVWGLGISFSRSAWIGFAVGVAILLAGWWRWSGLRPSPQQIKTFAAIFVITVAAFVLFYSKFVLTRAAISSEVTELRSISDRRLYLGIGLQAIAENPLRGVGAGAFPPFADAVIEAGPYAGWIHGDYIHNVPLLIWAELGIVGLVLWLLTWIASAILSWRHLRDPFAFGLAVGIVALLVTGLLDHYSWTMFHFVLLSYTGIAVVMRDHAHSTASGESEPASPKNL